MKVLRARLYEMELRKQQEAIAKDRRSQVGTGERSEKIRTYNFRDNRITDHRVHFTTHRLVEVLNGDLAELLDNVITLLPVREAQGRDGGIVSVHEQVAAARQRLRDAGISQIESRPRRAAARAARPRLVDRALPHRRARARAGRLHAELRALVVATRHARAVRVHRRRPRVLGAAFRGQAGGADSTAVDRADRRSGAGAVSRPGGAAGVADVCTGCGCVAVAIAHERPAATVVATDISRRRSKSRGATRSGTGSSDRVTFRHGDLLAGHRPADRRDPREPAVRRRSARRRRCSPKCATTSRPWRCLAGRRARPGHAARRRGAEPAAPGRLSRLRVRPRPGCGDRGTARARRPSCACRMRRDLQGIARTAVAQRS